MKNLKLLLVGCLLLSVCRFSLEAQTAAKRAQTAPKSTQTPVKKAQTAPKGTQKVPKSGQTTQQSVQAVAKDTSAITKPQTVVKDTQTVAKTPAAKKEQPVGKGNYKIANKFSLAGDDFWDYIVADEAMGRLFISHGSVVQVIDEKKGTLLGTISKTNGVHGIALAPEINKGYTSNGKDSTVTVFNYKTLAIIQKIKIPARNPDAILYEPITKKVYTFNGASATATVIDTKFNKVIDVIALDGKPEFAVTDGKGKIFVNVEDRSFIKVINAGTRKVIGEWSTSPGLGPTGLAIDKENQRLYSVCHNGLMVVIDTEHGRIISTLPIGDRVDGVAYDPDKKQIFSSNGDGTITVVEMIDNYNYKVLENFPTQKGARTITLDKKTHHIFLPVAEFNPVREGSSQRPTIKPGTFTILDIEPLN